MIPQKWQSLTRKGGILKVTSMQEGRISNRPSSNEHLVSGVCTMTIWNKTFAKAKRAKMAGMVALLPLALASNAAQAAAPAALKTEVAAGVDAQDQESGDDRHCVFIRRTGFSGGANLGLSGGHTEKNGFKVTRGVAGIPTAFTATWGEGGPLIALGSDIDGLLGVSQTPVRPPSSLWCPARRAMAKGIIRACR
jgi:hypothetical protein